MRVTAAVIAALIAAGCSSLEPLETMKTESITVETVDLPGRLWDPFMPPLDSGIPISIDGTLTIPPTDSPVPLVIITHGCGGPGGAERGWVSDIERMGYATLLLDSFGGRSISTLCFGRETVNVASILVDVFRAADLMADHPYVDGSHIALMGLSFGGRAALWSSLTRFQEMYDGRPFQAYIAFYPSTCFIDLQEDYLVTGGPIRIFHGTADDWTPIEQCRPYVDRLREHSVDASIYEYEGAMHGFDNGTLGFGVGHLEAVSPRNCHFAEIEGQIIDPDTGDVAGVGSPCVEIGVSFGFDAGAREAARNDLERLLGAVFGNEG